MTPEEQFKFGFLVRCAEEGLNAAQIELRTKQASWNPIDWLADTYDYGIDKARDVWHAGRKAYDTANQYGNNFRDAAYNSYVAPIAGPADQAANMWNEGVKNVNQYGKNFKDAAGYNYGIQPTPATAKPATTPAPTTPSPIKPAPQPNIIPSPKSMGEAAKQRNAGGMGAMKLSGLMDPLNLGHNMASLGNAAASVMTNPLGLRSAAQTLMHPDTLNIGHNMAALGNTAASVLTNPLGLRSAGTALLDAGKHFLPRAAQAKYVTPSAAQPAAPQPQPQPVAPQAMAAPQRQPRALGLDGPYTGKPNSLHNFLSTLPPAWEQWYNNQLKVRAAMQAAPAANVVKSGSASSDLISGAANVGANVMTLPIKWPLLAAAGATALGVGAGHLHQRALTAQALDPEDIQKQELIQAYLLHRRHILDEKARRNSADREVQFAQGFNG